MFIADLTVYR